MKKNISLPIAGVVVAVVGIVAAATVVAKGRPAIAPEFYGAGAASVLFAGSISITEPLDGAEIPVSGVSIDTSFSGGDPDSVVFTLDGHQLKQDTRSLYRLVAKPFGAPGTHTIAASVIKDGVVVADDSVTVTYALPENSFSIDDAVTVLSETDIYQTPGGTRVGTQAADATGAIVGGPYASEGAWYWRVDFVGGVDGWLTDSDL